MRGKRILYDRYITSSKTNSKGRDKLLIEARDNVLIYRYFFFVEVKRLRFDTVLEELSREFFISERTIQNRLEENQPQLDKIFKEKPTLSVIRRHCGSLMCEVTPDEKMKYEK